MLPSLVTGAGSPFSVFSEVVESPLLLSPDPPLEPSPLFVSPSVVSPFGMSVLVLSGVVLSEVGVPSPEPQAVVFVFMQWLPVLVNDHRPSMKNRFHVGQRCFTRSAGELSSRQVAVMCYQKRVPRKRNSRPSVTRNTHIAA